MLTCAVISLLIGALLSRSKVFVLIPAFLVTLLIAIGMIAFESAAAGVAAGPAAAAIIGLQIGYLLGAVLQHQSKHAHESRQLKSISPSS